VSTFEWTRGRRATTYKREIARVADAQSRTVYPAVRYGVERGSGRTLYSIPFDARHYPREATVMSLRIVASLTADPLNCWTSSRVCPR